MQKSDELKILERVRRGCRAEEELPQCRKQPRTGKVRRGPGGTDASPPCCGEERI